MLGKERDSRIALVGGRIEDPHLAAARCIYRCEPPAQRAGALYCDWTLAGVGREGVSHTSISYLVAPKTGRSFSRFGW